MTDAQGYQPSLVPYTTVPSSYPRYLRWSPDGSCLLVTDANGSISLFETNNIVNSRPSNPTIKYREPTGLRDLVWYPYMNSLDSSSCVFLTCCAFTPVHLWDAFDGSLRATYRTYDHYDEICPPYSAQFIANTIYCGFDSHFKVFDISRPGRDYSEARTSTKMRIGQKGIISCIEPLGESAGLFAAGSFSGTVGLYSTKSPSIPIHLISILPDNPKSSSVGVTKIQACQDGNLLLVGCRKSTSISVWDIRNWSREFARLEHRFATSNQKIGFDVWENRYVISGSRDGYVKMYDLTEVREIKYSENMTLEAKSIQPREWTIEASNQHQVSPCCCDVSVNECSRLVATAFGERTFTKEENYLFTNGTAIWKVEELKP